MAGDKKDALAPARERRYTAATHGPLTADWFAPGTSAQAEISFDIVTLRNRSREMVRNDGWAFAAIQAIANNVVGNGIRASFTGTSKRRDKIEGMFLNWCESTDCDFYDLDNFYGQQQLVVKAMAESGDLIVLKKYTGKGKKIKLSIQLLESDYLVHWLTALSVDKKHGEGAYVQNGIYFDGNDRIIGYELFKHHPGDNFHTNTYEHFFVSSDDCFLLFASDRVNQRRGFPWGSSVMLEHKMLNQYELASSHRNTITASYAVFITSASAESIGKSPTDTEPRDSFGWNGEKVVPGSIINLLPGEEVTTALPPKADATDEHVKSKLRKISKGWGLSYEVLSGDLSNVNFSSGRMGWLEMSRNIQAKQNLVMIPKFCRKIANWWIELEQIKGTIPLDLGDIGISWTPPRREMIDPVKETKAMVEQIQAGLLDFSEAVKQMGGDPLRHMIALKQTAVQITTNGLILSSDYRVINAQLLKAGSDKPVTKTKPVKKKEKPV